MPEYAAFFYTTGEKSGLVMTEPSADPFRSAFKGRFENVLRWEQLDILWKVLKQDADGGWHIYAVGEAPPYQPADAALITSFLVDIEQYYARNMMKTTVAWSLLIPWMPPGL